MKILALLLSLLPLRADPIRDFWFNGAEISSYDLTQARYGSTHKGHAELIFVTEPFLLDRQVKDEDGSKNSVEILKLNALTTFNTGLYSYRTMTSTFQPIKASSFPFGLKSSASIQDWCGQSFQQLNLRENSWNVKIFSYFENPGDKTASIPEAYLEDSLWLILRLDPKKLPTGSIEAIPGSVYLRLHHRETAVYKAKAILNLDGKKSTYILSYPTLKRTLTINFKESFPHEILGWTEEVDTSITTATHRGSMMNVNYWELNKPGHSTQRRKLGLTPRAN